LATINLPGMRRSLRVLIHGAGLSSLAAALFLQGTVFLNILQKGYFRGIETNPTILYSEIGLTGFAITYLCYMFARFIWSNR
jgi:hypothetical protein